MKKFSIALLLIASVANSSCKNDTQSTNEETTTSTPVDNQKIVTLSGAITETVAALGKSSEIVGRDVTSTFPADLTATDLGHVGRGMTVEGVMATNPTLVIALEKEAGSEVLTKVKESGIKTEFVPQEYSVEGAKNLIKSVASLIGSSEFQPLLDKIDSDMAQVQPIEKKPKVLFIYSRANMLMVAGAKTPMEAIINLAGGESAVTEFEEFKPLTPESLIQANPDVILMFDKGVEGLGGLEAVLKVPGVEQTNAGKNKKIISLDGGLLTNFGPRTGEAALELNKLLIEATK
ncbi:heme/hemin ABC transporter substrate-binding protein [Moheibacter stercoris]|uniref:Iron complex transport system substrate-binding protein n=1 Tax=Moheibacter stercoris TaxID=1628251 RepID=A0ABV2LTL8_9FLAO